MFGETFKNMSVNLVSSNPRGTFISGDELRGKLKFELSKDINIQYISMALRGRAKVVWTTRSGSGKHRHTTTHTGKHEYFKIEGFILRGATDEITLNRGTHVYPFTCQIPHGDFPPSFNGVKGKISYAVIFGIHRKWHMTKEYVSEFMFENHSCDMTLFSSPVILSNSKTVCCLCCTSGTISLDGHLEKKAFIPGETIRLQANIINGSSRTVVPEAVLMQRQTFYSTGRHSRFIAPRSVVGTVGHSVGPNRSDVHMEILLPIPEDVGMTIMNCPVLEVEYLVLVTLKISGSWNLHTSFPLVVCNAPMQQSDCPPPSYNEAINMF